MCCHVGVTNIIAGALRHWAVVLPVSCRVNAAAGHMIRSYTSLAAGYWRVGPR
jgi:hypothetical protein